MIWNLQYVSQLVLQYPFNIWQGIEMVLKKHTTGSVSDIKGALKVSNSLERSISRAAKAYILLWRVGGITTVFQGGIWPRMTGGVQQASSSCH